MTDCQIGDIKVSAGALDVMYKLHFYGPQEDGDLPSKSGMTELIMIGVAKKDYTKRQSNLLTDKGMVMAAMHYRDNPPEHRGSKS